MGLPYVKQRKALHHLQKGIANGQLTFGFIGGSITDARPRHNWPEFFMEQFVHDYPKVRCKVENAAIGATGSDLAVFRAKRDLIDRNCHIVFIEFAVNDEDVESVRRYRTREGLIRQLLQAGIEDMVLVYTYSEGMREAIEAGKYPTSIAEFEVLADYYQLPSVWVGKYGVDQVKQGRLTMDEWLPDGLHPQHKGSQLYAELVYSTIKEQIERVNQLPVTSQVLNHTDKLPHPRDGACWQKTEWLPSSQIKLEGEWLEYRWHNYEWFETMLETKQPKASLNFSFYGRGAVLAFDFGSQSLEFKYRINEGEWQFSNRDCPEWVGRDGWLRMFELASTLPSTKHHIEIVVLERENNGDTMHFRLGKVGILI